MADTANFGWTKPDVGGDNGTWGTKLNTALDDIDADLDAVRDTADAALPKAGGVMTGRADIKTATIARQDKGSVSAAVSFDLSVAQVFTLTLSGAAVFAMTNPVAGTLVQAAILKITNGVAGVTWPAGTRWAGATPPVLTSGEDIVVLISFNNGTNWYGLVGGKNFA
jgi:hypothetical protein